jgi:hypothetical protein
MRIINPYSHIPYLHTRFMRMLATGTFAKSAWRQIGANIDSLFDDDDEEWTRRSLMSSRHPATSLFLWLHAGGRLDIEWLRADDGRFYDDKGNVIAESVELQISPVEHLAAYGLWLIEEDADSCGPSTEEDWDEQRINPNGWTEAQVLHHKAECLLVAYQALHSAQRILDEMPISPEEANVISNFDFSAIGKSGADKRHAPMRALRAYAVELYRPEDWSSANEAAHALMGRIMDHGRTINAKLQPANAQRTIAEWFRKKRSSGYADTSSG